MKLKRWIVLVLLIGLQWTAHADVLLGHVVGVSDGDTITVLDDNKQRHVIRLMGIDAPEKAQAFGQRAKLSLSDLVFHRDVSVTWFKRDRYGRTVGQVYVDDTDVCLEQIKRGLAWHYKQYMREQSIEDRSRYSDAEEQARIASIGLWSDLLPLQPSEFRNILNFKNTNDIKK
jgi:endonuclease YncB( thermonuclease family)